jgi:adenylyltransferase/sulfurtransferase
MTIVPNESACYRCIFKNPPPTGVVPTCQEAGIIGVVAGIIGTIQATEAIKLILKIGQPLTDRLLDFDARTTTFREIRVKRNPTCALCGPEATLTELLNYDEPEACAI